MGNCIICGTSTDGPICDTHQEDVLFEFRGNSASQLTEGRFYRGTVDGYADFGVFVDLAPNVTGLLHRSKIDRRLEALDWEPGDDVFVQVTNVRDNGDIDLGWSIRQSDREFRGVLVQDPEGDHLAETDESDADETSDESGTTEGGTGGSATGESVRDRDTGGDRNAGGDQGSSGSSEQGSRRSSRQGSGRGSESDSGGGTDAGDEPSRVEATPGRAGTTESDSGSGTSAQAEATGETAGGTPGGTDGPGSLVEADETDRADGSAEAGDEREEERAYERVEVGSLADRVGEDVRLEGEVVSVRQTSGPTVFELRDETGVVDCAAFVEAGVRAYPDVETGDLVRLDGEMRVRRDEPQVETEGLVVLEGDEREAVESRMAEALKDEAAPDDFELLVDDDALEGLIEDVEAAATAVRRAVLESRPVVVRHSATTDGYVAGAAVERAVLPLVREEHAGADATYHYFDRRPLEDGTYDMDDATKDVTRMLDNRERHDEKLPLFVFAAAGSTADSLDGIGLLDVYGAESVVVDAIAADEAVGDTATATVTGDVDRTAATLAANVAAAVNDEVRGDLGHLPAVTYWEDAPAPYVALAEEAGLDEEAASRLREAIALEAYYQSYEDKRELIIDLLFDREVGLAEQVSGQFRTKLDAELETAEANVETRTVDGVGVTELDTDAYTHRFDFPPKALLLDELHRRHRDETPVVVGYSKDELYVRSTADVDLHEIAAAASDRAPNAGISARGARTGKLVFLSGRRGDVVDAVVEAVVERS